MKICLTSFHFQRKTNKTSCLISIRLVPIACGKIAKKYVQRGCILVFFLIFFILQNSKTKQKGERNAQIPEKITEDCRKKSIIF